MQHDNYIAELDFGRRRSTRGVRRPDRGGGGRRDDGPAASIWYGAVARADAEVIEIGEGSNVQDGCTLHSDPGFPLLVGRASPSATASCCTARGSTTTSWSAWAAS